MGGKITIDSATLMNKGLELIEAHHLFGVPYERIDVVVHPQSLIHSLVHLIDGATLAHLAIPTCACRSPTRSISPERADVPVEPLDLAAVGELTFERARPGDVPPACGSPARPARRAAPRPACSTPPTRSPSRAFLDGRAPVHRRSPTVVEATLEAIDAAPPTHFDDLFDCDAAARAARRRAHGAGVGEPRA